MWGIQEDCQRAGSGKEQRENGKTKVNDKKPPRPWSLGGLPVRGTLDSPLMSACDQQKPFPLPHPPQQRRSKMIHKQSFPPPHPLLPQNPPLLPQQQLNKMMIQRIELHPPSLHPHPPQFVAAKSLMPETSRKCLQFIIWKGQLLCDKAVDRKTKISYNNYGFNIFVIFATKLTHSFVRK